MSTTVNYKGQNLTTVNNETKTLTTQGKYLEGNITLTDVTQSSTLGTKTIVSNGTYDASSDSLDGYSEVTVNVPTPSPTLQTKSVSYTPTESAQSASVTADSGYDGLDTVNVSVGAIDPNYVGSNISRMSAQTVTPTEQTQTVSTNGKYMTGDVTVNPIPSSYIVPSGSQSITANGTYDVTALAEVTVNVSGGSGGSGNFETGTLELTSNFSLTTSAKKITGLQLSFKPDYFMLTPDRASFEARESYSGGLWELVAFKKSLFTPYANSSSVSPEAVSTNDYGFFYRSSVVSNSSVSCGYGLGGLNFLGQNYYSRYAVNDDGTISVGRYSSASTKIFAGKYKYIAIKF